jgi:bifunctional non-homologous end joining protein LigD
MAARSTHSTPLPRGRPGPKLQMDGDDLHALPLSMRKASLARLLARRPDGVFLTDFEQGEIGPDLFRKACEFGWRAWYRSIWTGLMDGTRCKHWIKVKNPASAAPWHGRKRRPKWPLCFHERPISASTKHQLYKSDGRY